MDANQARTEANHEEMLAKLDVHHERVMTCLEKTEAYPEEMESKSEDREEEEAAVNPVRGLRKRHRRRNLATGHHHKPKKLAAAHRCMTHS
jgi:hypothetical protein